MPPVAGMSVKKAASPTSVVGDVQGNAAHEDEYEHACNYAL